MIAPRERRQCEWCQAALGERVPVVPARPDETIWVAVRCEFQCRSCGFFVPLDHLDIDGRVDCLRCGVEQVFDVDSWRVGLAAAHEVGDLAGPDPEGQFPNPHCSIAARNPQRAIGITATAAISAQAATTAGPDGVHHRSLRVAAAPGCPLCDSCSTPLTVVVAGRSARATCARCGEHASYELPERAPALYHNLIAALAPEHRTDAADAAEDVSAGGGAVSVRCPNCAGPIAVDGESHFECCDFCHTTVRIRDETLRKLIADPRPLPWWLLFRGPSQTRIELEKSAALADGKPRGKIEQAPVHVRGWRAAALRIALPVALLIAVGAIGFGDRIAAWAGRWDTGAIADGLSKPELPGVTPAPTPEATPPVEPVPAPTPAVSPVPSVSVPTTGCRCQLDGGETVELAVDARAAAGGILLSGRVEVDGQPPIDLPAADIVGPPRPAPGRRSRAQVGLACAGSDVVVAWGNRVIRFAIPQRSIAWSVALPRPAYGAVPAVPANGALSLRCRKLDLRGGKIKVPLGRSSARLRLDTGAAI